MFFKGKDRSERFEVLIPSLFLSFTFFIFGPIKIYMTGVVEFWFGINQFIPINIALFLALWIVLSILGILLKNNTFFISALFGISLAMYIQGDWLYTDYGKMDGTTIDWDTYGAWPYLNLAIWGIVILAPIILSFCLQNKRRIKRIIQNLCFGILVMQCITLGALGLSTDLSKNQDYYVAKDDQMLEFSKDKNIVVMLFDAFQASYFEQAIEDIPDAESIFKDFVFFDKATGTSLYSEEGSATILTGNQLRQDLPFDQNIDYIYSESTFLSELEKHNYDVRYYMRTKMVSPSSRKIIKNVVEKEQESFLHYDIFKIMNRITAFRYMPHIVKKYFWYSYNDIENIKQTNKSEFVASDDSFNQAVLGGGITSASDKKVYRMYYFKGVHPPYDLDAEGNFVSYDDESYLLDYVEDIHDNEKMYQQALGSIQIMANFIQSLKDEGIYDKTNIIITADHGWENRYNPLLLIKTEDTVGQFKISHAPVSYISDFGPTIMSIIDDSYHGEKTVFDYAEGEKRERRFYIYDIDPSDRSYYARDTYILSSTEVIPSKFYRVLEEEEISYHIGDKILFTDEDDGGRYFSLGISYVETDSAWSLGKSGQIILNMDDFEGDLTGEFQFKAIYAAPQKLIIRSNGQILYDAEVSSAEELVSFAVPAGCVKNGQLVLDLEYPDAVSPASRNENTDGRELAFRFSSIRFFQDQKEEVLYHMGDKILFTDENDGGRYFSQGISYVETDSAWSLGKSGQIVLNVDNFEGDLTGEFQFKAVYAGPQKLIVRSNGQILYDAEITSVEEPVKFTIPEGCVKNGQLVLDLEYPNAVSPASRHESTDNRELALRFSSIYFYENR